MKSNYFGKGYILTPILVISLLIFPLISHSARDINIGSGSEAGTYYPFAVGIADVLNEHLKNIRAVAHSTGGSAENNKRMLAKAMEMAMMQNDVAFYAYEDLEKVADVAAWIKRAEGWKQYKNGKWFQDEDSEPVAFRLIDTSANITDRTSGMSVNAAFARHGLIFANAWKMGYMASIDRVKEMLNPTEQKYEWTSGPDLIIFNTCRRLGYEMQNFIWRPESSQARASGADAEDKPLKTNDDCVDCKRYLVMSGAKFHSLVHILSRERDLW